MYTLPDRSMLRMDTAIPSRFFTPTKAGNTGNVQSQSRPAAKCALKTDWTMQQQRTLSGLLNCELLCLQEFQSLERFSQELAGYLNDCSD